MACDVETGVGKPPPRHVMQSVSEVGPAPNPHVTQAEWHAHPGTYWKLLSKHMELDEAMGGEGGGGDGDCAVVSRLARSTFNSRLAASM